jgi:hypothetical protein
MPSSVQSSPTLVSGLPMDAIARRSFAGVILYGRPPVHPRARAEARPARVRSAINSLSNSARAAKMPKISFPAGVVVSNAAPWPERTFKPIPCVVSSCTIYLQDALNRAPVGPASRPPRYHPLEVPWCRRQDQAGRHAFLMPDLRKPVWDQLRLPEERPSAGRGPETRRLSILACTR